MLQIRAIDHDCAIAPSEIQSVLSTGGNVILTHDYARFTLIALSIFPMMGDPRSRLSGVRLSCLSCNRAGFGGFTLYEVRFKSYKPGKLGQSKDG